MSHRIISPSTSNAPTAAAAGSTGYDYTIGPQQTLPNEQATVSSTIYNGSLHPNARKTEVSLSSYAFLFQEIVSQQHSLSKSVKDLETRLNSLGYTIGLRLLELLNFRSSIPQHQQRAFFNNANNSTGTTTSDESLASSIVTMKRRDLKILDILQFIHSTVWRYLFDHVSDDLVKSSERENEYMIIDNLPSLTQFIGSANISCDSFVCGILEGLLDSASFPCAVSAHSMPEGQFSQRVVYLIKFNEQVVERESLRF